MGSLSQLIIMQLGRSFLLLISLVLAYCAADIQVQQIENVVEGLHETGGIEFKDDIEDTGDASEDLLNVEEVLEEVEEKEKELELDDSESLIDIEDAGQMEEETQPETINEEDSEDDFSEFNEEESSNDIAEAAEVLTEEIESERKIGFFGRLARSFSFGSKN